MKVYLKSDVPNLGNAHEIQDVAPGYARNYLIPQGLAVPATPGQIRAAKAYASSQEAREARVRAESEKVAEKLNAASLQLTAKAGETGRLYGSITSADVAKEIARELNMHFDKRWLEMDRPIRDLGEHKIDVKLDAGVRAQVEVVVVAEA